MSCSGTELSSYGRFKPERAGEADLSNASPPSAANPDEFTTLFQESYRLFWTIAAGIIGCRDRAEDVVQDAAMIGLGKYHEFSPGTAFTAWMGQIVRFVALNHLRKHCNQPLGIDATTLDGSLTSRPYDSAERSFELGPAGELKANQDCFDDRVMHALGALTGIARACLLLRTLEGLSYAEIAGLLKIPEGTAMSHVSRARSFLRKRLAGVR